MKKALNLSQVLILTGFLVIPSAISPSTYAQTRHEAPSKSDEDSPKEHEKADSELEAEEEVAQSQEKAPEEDSPVAESDKQMDTSSNPVISSNSTHGLDDFMNEMNSLPSDSKTGQESSYSPRMVTENRYPASSHSNPIQMENEINPGRRSRGAF